LLRDSRRLVRRALLFLRLRKVLQRKWELAVRAARVIPGEHCAQGARCEGGEPNFLGILALQKLASLPSTRARARASPGMTMEARRMTQRHAATMTNRRQTAMPFAAKFAMAFP